MPTTVKGVISRAKGAPVELVDIVIPDPGPGEVVVDVKSCGVCHTDFHYREGGIGDEYPYLLGHESAGVVSEVGEGVTEVAVGDFVVLNWRAICGDCRACKRGEPWYCFDTHNATQKMTLAEDGTELSPALGIGSFAEKTLVAAGQCTKVPESDPAVVGLLGCGVMAGIGAAINTGNVTRGKSVAVIGCGGVGMASVVGSRLAGAGTIIAIDRDPRKLEWALERGATHTIDSSGLDEDGVVAAVQELTNGFGADVVIDAVGRPETWRQAFYARDLAGTVVLVGVPTPEMELTVPLADVFGRGGSLKSSWYGDCLPDRDFPMLVDLYEQGRLPLEGFVSERIGIEDVEEAFAKMGRGEVLRSVVEIP
ncbi:S-(hydroxymethyl)mycothiol dehydrogenase [Brevibacterium yomogidense]|uniref:S-(hydroxymethyl)mycothiol dehydrogenase n=1 Tax=Brevibacterium yomogidense TaxID=946573 RepID=UPI0018E0231C|nr:S-(hydroxymethyl)mycothiol dehydrogenase [Brevibacterium yomogidense]